MNNWVVIQHSLDNVEDLKQDFGVPEQKKFPLHDREHVKSAIKFFNYVDPVYEEKLANAIINKINEYEMDDIYVGDDNRFKNYYNPETIEHHGIKGQKWGVRRYQNADGTLTEAGRKRYNSGEAILNKWGDQEGLARAKTARNTAGQALAATTLASTVGGLLGGGAGAIVGQPYVGAIAGSSIGSMAGSIAAGIAYINGEAKQGRITDAYNAKYNK